ncbi:MAG: transporter substrate-binding domain-containing protein [Desulfarculus sp.]|nr:transporter substrate-binding domain-containing protein [Desulfarculus sp.]
MTPRQLLAWLLLLGCLAPTPAAAQEEPLAIYYFHRPPYYLGGSQPGEGCRGLVLERACRALEAAGVPYTLVEMPVKRVLNQIRWGHYACGVGWFKLAPRLAYANFSLPLYQGLPLTLVVNKQRAAHLALPARPTLEQALKSGLVLGTLEGYAYGHWADAHIARLRPPTMAITGTPDNMLRMLASGRCDFWLSSGEEAQWLLAHHAGLAPLLEIRPLADAPPSEPRHLMCGKQVPARVLQMVDQALAGQGAFTR